MENKKLTKEELQEIKNLNEEKNKLTFNFGRLKTDMILVEAKMKELVKMEEDMVASVIWTKGTQPRRFLGRAYDKNKRKVPKLMAQQLAARLSEIANQQIAVKKR